MTQIEITQLVDTADELISRTMGFHCTNGLCDYIYVIAKDGILYNVGLLITPWETPSRVWLEPEIKSYGHQLKLAL